MKKLLVIILVFATILNIIAGAFIFLDIQQMNIPETTLTIEIINITSDEAVLQATVFLDNPNPFPILLENLTMITVADTGEIINQLHLGGGQTNAHANRTITSAVTIRFNGSLPNGITSKITGTFGTTFLGLIKKTFPLKFSLVASLNDILTQFSLPQVHLAANFSDISQEGINFTGVIEITNPNTIDIAIEDISLDIETNTGIPVGATTIQGKTIPAKSTKQLTGSGQLQLKAIDAQSLRMSLDGKFIVFAAGVRKPMNLSIDADIIPPCLEQLLSDIPTEASLTGNYRYTFKEGLRDERLHPEIDN